MVQSINNRSMATIWLFSPQGATSTTLKQLLGTFAIRLFVTPKVILSLLKCHLHPDLLIIADEHKKIDISSIIKKATTYYTGNILQISNRQLTHNKSINNTPLYTISYCCSELALIKTINQLTTNNLTPKEQKTIVYEDIHLDTQSLNLKVISQQHTLFQETLPLKEAQLLRILLLSAQMIISRKQIKQQIWPDTIVSPRTIDTHISRLRNKLSASSRSIEAIYGQGYCLQ